jgi:benzoate/toluate 1,2-dioxygenase beta subunit/2,4,5-trichlorophenoxyacetic acid oxygenase 2
MIEIDTDRSIGAAEAIARDVLYRETEALDRQEWNNWLDCYCEDARFWVPTWIAEHKLADDPDHQVSMIYHVGRRELEERVFRITSLKSVTAMPLPRTLHMLSNIRVSGNRPQDISVSCTGQTAVYDVRLGIVHPFFARYTYALREAGGSWRISEKIVHLINDRVPTVLDFYSI